MEGSQDGPDTSSTHSALALICCTFSSLQQASAGAPLELRRSTKHALVQPAAFIMVGLRQRHQDRQPIGKRGIRDTTACISHITRP